MESCIILWLPLIQTKQPEIITVSSSGKYFGIQFKRKLRIWKVPTAESERAVVKKITLHHTKNMNVLACRGCDGKNFDLEGIWG
jgi:NET1-associated nuclear protein 1 (U3 small nucleolar RNA-associated protein 17)